MAFRARVFLLLAGVFCGAAELQPQTPTVLTLPPSNGHRLYVQAFPLAHAPDSKIVVLDGDSFKFLGTFMNGFFGLFAPSADGGTIYSATTYFARGDHGARTDVLELWDTRTLALQGEVVLPPKRAQSTANPSYIVESAGGTYLFVQNATPASSVTVVDLARRRVLTELETAGCIGIYPSPIVAARFSTLCGDGAAVTIGFDADGHETSRQRSVKFFDPAEDALFTAGAQSWDRTIFVSFLGHVQPVDFSGIVAVPEKAWPLVQGADVAKGWRPGGYTPVAVDRATGRIYVAMHAHGVEGSHKDGADEIWRADLDGRRVEARGPGAGVSALAVSDEKNPVLFGENIDQSMLVRFDGKTLKQLGTTQANGLLEGGGQLVVK